MKIILNLSPSLKQVVKVPTRLNPDAILDPIITSMTKYYSPPVTKPPLDNDANKKGQPSDHLVVLMYPLNSQLNCSPRKSRIVKCRPLPESGIRKLGAWIQEQNWKCIYRSTDVNEKATMFQNMIKEKLDLYLPEKTMKVFDDDKPWITKEVKDLDRKCKREYYKHRKSDRWQSLRNKFKEKCEQAKEKYQTDTIEDLKHSNISQWYSKIKRMGGINESKADSVHVSDLENLECQEQAEVIANHYAQVSNQYDHLETADIPLTLYETDELLGLFRARIFITNDFWAVF